MKEYINEGERAFVQPDSQEEMGMLVVANRIPIRKTGREKEFSLCEWMEESERQYNSAVKTWKIRIFPVINDGRVVAIGREDVSV